jgi:hypothetical protein
LLPPAVAAFLITPSILRILSKAVELIDAIDHVIFWPLFWSVCCYNFNFTHILKKKKKKSPKVELKGQNFLPN